MVMESISLKTKLIFFWLLAFFMATFILSNSHFKSESNDSKYYTSQVVRYQNETFENIMTAKWGENYWGFDPKSYDLDNFPGQLILGLAVTKLGAPPEQALHILGMAFQIFSIFLLVNIAKEFIESEAASVLYYAVLLTPMAFAYNIRANHELGIMFFSLLSLYSGLKLPQVWWWGILIAISATMLLWIKGPFFIFAPILATIGFVFKIRSKKQIIKLVFACFLVILAVTISAILFENFFVKITGQSFLLGFYKIQITGRQIPYTSSFSFITLKLYNFYYYFWHYLVYALPWTLFLLIIILKNKMFSDFKLYFKTPISLCFLIAAATFLFVFSVNSRHAARYVFPAYYLFSAWVILSFYHLSPKFQKWHQDFFAARLYLMAPILWLIIFSLHFVPK